MATADAERMRSPPVRNQVRCQGHCRVVLVGAPKPHRLARLVSPDEGGAALTRLGYANARFHSAIWVRAARPLI